MKRTFDTDTIRLMTLFENVTNAPVMDCIVDKDSNTICFVVGEGKIGLAIGRNGSSVRHVERITGKTVRLFEFSGDLDTFVKRLIPQANRVRVKCENNETVVEISVEKKNRAFVIGRDSRNLRMCKELLKRSHRVDELSVK